MDVAGARGMGQTTARRAVHGANHFLAIYAFPAGTAGQHMHCVRSSRDPAARNTKPSGIAALRGFVKPVDGEGEAGVLARADAESGQPRADFLLVGTGHLDLLLIRERDHAIP